MFPRVLYFVFCVIAVILLHKILLYVKYSTKDKIDTRFVGAVTGIIILNILTLYALFDIVFEQDYLLTYVIYGVQMFLILTCPTEKWKLHFLLDNIICAYVTYKQVLIVICIIVAFCLSTIGTIVDTLITIILVLAAQCSRDDSINDYKGIMNWSYALIIYQQFIFILLAIVQIFKDYEVSSTYYYCASLLLFAMMILQLGAVYDNWNQKQTIATKIIGPHDCDATDRSPQRGPSTNVNDSETQTNVKD